jgi:membrane fusion protein, multidrug efflux system
MEAAKRISSISVRYARNGRCLLILLPLLTACAKKQPPQGAFGPVPVSVVTVKPSDVQVRNEWVGTLDGFVNAQIQPQVTGYLVRQTYKEGSQVSKGQVLFEIDPRPFQAVLAQAQGQLGQAKAQVAQSKAQLELTNINVNRDTPLAEQRAIAQSQLDNEKQQQAQARAAVEAAEANVSSAQAAIDTANLNLGFTHVRSLIDGVAGQATTQVGNLVSPQSVLTAVSQLNPVKIYFSMSDSEYLSLVSRSGKGNNDLLKAAASIPLTLRLADGTTYPQKGHIAFVDRQMDQQTGSIRIAAVFQNPGNLLRPGQFGRISAETRSLSGVLLVPQIAVQDLQGIKQVYVAGDDNKVHIANVQLGPESGDSWVITSGLKPGARVITDQLQKLREGAPINPHEATPSSSAATPQGKNPAGR